MHRAGTSVAARAIQLLGVSLGDRDRFLPPGPDNPAGYFEVSAIMELNNDLLAHLGGSWDQPPVLDPGWEEDASLDEFRSHASAVLDETFGEPAVRPELIGWKDPRLSLLLPFWRTVTPITTTIVMVRNPVEVATSLALRRQRVAASQAAILWLRYILAATTNDPGHLLLRQEDFLIDLRDTLDAVASHLGLPAPGDEVVAAVDEHVDPALRHHLAPPPPASDNPLMTLAVAVWNDGDVDVGVMPRQVADAITRGWLRAPADTELLDEARAQVVELTQRLQRRWREQNAPGS
jgi:O-antigen biosynthesis protein